MLCAKPCMAGEQRSRQDDEETKTIIIALDVGEKKRKGCCGMENGGERAA